ncbi:MAG: amidohydrolase family protein [Chlorobi bacterium]|nr:amidohydrolase family protein [Chlorobiota bacterium]
MSLKRFICFAADTLYCSFKPLRDIKSIVVNRASGTIVDLLLDVPEESEILEVVEFKGIIIPAFIDAHTHILGYAADKGLDLRGISTWEEVAEIIKTAEPTHQHWLIARGWDESKMQEGKIPDKQWLNAIRNDIPVVLIRVDGHMAICNDRAIKESGLDAYNGKDFDGNRGFVKEEALNILHKAKPVVSLEQFMKNYTDLENWFLRHGVVGSCEAGINSNLVRYIEKLNPLIKHSVLLLAEDHNAQQINLLPFTLSNGIKFSGIKMFYDGSLGSNTALLFDSYRSVKNYFGLQVKPTEYYRHWLETLKNREDIIIATHAIGDRAVHEIAELYSTVQPVGIKRIEHVQIIRDNTISLLRENNIVASIQPIHLLTDKRWIASKLNKSSLEYAYRFKTLMNNVPTILGTDFPVEEVDPFMNLYAAMFRKNPDEADAFHPQESLSIYESMDAYTAKAARYSLLEGLGTLDRGNKASFVVVDRDFIKRPEEVASAQVKKVFVDGIQRFG